MHNCQQIKADIEAVKQEIRYARAEGETQLGMEILYNELEQLENSLCATGTDND
jgi:hypothetical protein